MMTGSFFFFVDLTNFLLDGGGYGAGNADMDMTWMIETSKTKFVGVAIQYRVGRNVHLFSFDPKVRMINRRIERYLARCIWVFGWK